MRGILLRRFIVLKQFCSVSTIQYQSRSTWLQTNNRTAIGYGSKTIAKSLCKHVLFFREKILRNVRTQVSKQRQTNEKKTTKNEYEKNSPTRPLTLRPQQVDRHLSGGCVIDRQQIER